MPEGTLLSNVNKRLYPLTGALLILIPAYYLIPALGIDGYLLGISLTISGIAFILSGFDIWIGFTEWDIESRGVSIVGHFLVAFGFLSAGCLRIVQDSATTLNAVFIGIGIVALATVIKEVRTIRQQYPYSEQTESS